MAMLAAIAVNISVVGFHSNPRSRNCKPHRGAAFFAWFFVTNTLYRPSLYRAAHTSLTELNDKHIFIDIFMNNLSTENSLIEKKSNNMKFNAQTLL